MYFNLQNPNLKSIFVGWHSKTSIGNQENPDICSSNNSYNNESKHGKSEFLGGEEQDIGTFGPKPKKNFTNLESSDNLEKHKKN